MLYKAIIKAMTDEMNCQPENAIEDDFFNQAIQVIHFFSTIDLSEEDRKLLLPFIQKINQMTSHCVAPLFLKMYKTECLDGPYAKKINLMLEPMSKEDREKACAETIRLLEDDCGGSLPSFHLGKIREIFGIA